MRKGSMFSRLLAYFLAVILLCVSTLFVIFYVNLRNRLIDNRMDALKNQAEEMAYLVNVLSMDTPSLRIRQSTTTEQYIYRKASSVYQEYNAYIVIYDRDGSQRTYYNEDTLKAESMIGLPDSETLKDYLNRVVRGEEIIVQTDSPSGPLFTVVVPWERNNVLTHQKTVMGIVLIQTAAQTVHAAYSDLVWQVALAALALFIAAAVVVLFFTRRTTKPLTVMADTAGKLAQGDFSSRVPEEGTREVQELAEAFNQMSSQLSSLEQSRRDFVANVSHELRSPITSMQGFVQGMLDGTIPPAEHEKYLQVVVDETHRLSKLIANLLNLSRMENDATSLAWSDFDLNEMTRRVIISRMTQLEDKKLDMDVDFAEETCFVHADSDQIQQVIINLLDNAVKYTPENGKICLATGIESDHVFLRIRDNGIGILPEDAPHIFDRFYKADKAHTVGKGTGLGLAICYRIMEKHGQKIKLLSGNGGAEFMITLEKGKAPVGLPKPQPIDE